jgi:phage gpG-like protein
MMVRSGTLRTALLVEGVRELTKNRLVYGVEGPAEKYAAAHQKGTGRLPQRKLISLTQSERRGWDRIFHEWIIKQRRGVLR